jgi:hypothetical protein
VDFVLIPELSLFPFCSVFGEQVMGGIHFFPAFKFRGNLKLMRIRESSSFFGHFHSPFVGGVIALLEKLASG